MIEFCRNFVCYHFDLKRISIVYFTIREYEKNFRAKPEDNSLQRYSDHYIR